MFNKKKIDYIRIIVLGVLPKYRKTGIDSILYWEFGDRAGKYGIKGAEASWILENNVLIRMVVLCKHFEYAYTYVRQVCASSIFTLTSQTLKVTPDTQKKIGKGLCRHVKKKSRGKKVTSTRTL